MQREIGDAIDAEHHRFAVDDEAALADLSRRLHDPRISVGPVVTTLGDQPDAVAVPLQPEPVAVVLETQSGPVGTVLDLVGRQNSNIFGRLEPKRVHRCVHALLVKAIKREMPL